MDIRRSSLTVLCLLAANTAALAQTREIKDDATGFSVVVPEPLRLQEKRQRANYDLVVDVVSDSSEPPAAGTSSGLCSVGFTKPPAGLSITQQQLNDPVVVQQNMQAGIKAQSLLGTVASNKPIEKDGAAGFEIVTDLRPDARFPTSRSYFAMIDRPSGRTTIVCATTAEAFDAALPMFRAIRAGSN